MKNLKGKIALITGGAQGIGREIALALAAAGTEIVLTDINEETLGKTRTAIEAKGVRCWTYKLDVTDLPGILETREKVRKDVGSLDILVNNAGIVFGGPFLDIPLEKHLRTYAINTNGLVAVTHAFLPMLIERKEAHLVDIASASGLIGLPYGSTYASSKWAAIGFSESIRLELKELGHHHVHVTTVCPSYVGTGMFDGVKPPLGTRLLDPADLARKVVQAVRHERVFVLEPWLVKVTPLIKGVLPSFISDKVSDLFGATAGMHDWRGHQGSAKPDGGQPSPR
jgi:all-trans-retinol dehydrogenase (NAD+)